MRSSEEIKNLIIGIASKDDRVRAVLLSGSRANHKISPDKYQDFDIVYIVDDLESFISDKSWTNIFGDKLIWQLPDDMAVGKKDSEKSSRFALLMLFTDGNRIDLTLLPTTEIKDNYKPGSLTIVWLDKDNMFSNIGLPNDSDYLVKEPTKKQFLDTCNEFWWVCTYVAKGLARDEIIYSKEMLETVVRPMFMNVIAWYIGIETNFSVSTGKGRFIKSLLPSDLYNDILETYSDRTLENNWKALFSMMDIFGKLARAISGKLNFGYITSEEENVTAYLNQLYEEQVSDKI
ncbi:MAG TPA: aminoglycoside 6-adenylyltransferase [Chitinophagaceae bacterium]|nr:aminoglycoside 6-adenylyltransferase [Chitinophagaceae bacterium]